MKKYKFVFFNKKKNFFTIIEKFILFLSLIIIINKKQKLFSKTLVGLGNTQGEEYVKSILFPK